MPRAKQAEFQVSYVWMALAVAIFGGFALAGHLAFLIGFNQSLGDGFASHIQIHGHLQLVGWAGLFIIGISLHFIPTFIKCPHFTTPMDSPPTLVHRNRSAITIYLSPDTALPQ